MEYESMGRMIQKLRKEKGITQRDLAEQLNITDKAVSKWERDIARPDISILPQLAVELDTTVEALVNAQEKEIETNAYPEETCSEETNMTDPKDINLTWETYKKRSRVLLRQGIPGFVIGSLLLFVAVVVLSIASGTFNILEMLETIILALLFGIFCAGIPSGWKTISKWTGQWVIYGNVLILLFLFMLKIVATFALAMTAYPVALIYNLIRSQKTKKNVRIFFAIWVLAGIAYVVFAIMMAMPQ